jgi:hypothetical protein
MGRKPAIQLGLLRRSQLQLALILDDAVPDALDQIDTLSDGKLPDLRGQGRLSHQVDSSVENEPVRENG